MSDRVQWRIWLNLEDLVVLIATILAFISSGHSWWLFAAFFFVPDLSMLGFLFGRQVGAISYNIAHSYAGPLILAAYGIIAPEPFVMAPAIIWGAHIAVDRLLGFGLKSTAGFRHTHLGYVGKPKPDAA